MRKLFSVLCVILSLFFLFVFSIQKKLEISFVQDSKREVLYQVFYTTKKDPNFCEINSIKKKIVKGKHNVSFLIGAKDVENIRLDFDGLKNNDIIDIKDIKFSGKRVPLDNIIVNDIGKYDVKTDSIQISDVKIDPFFILNSKIDNDSYVYHIMWENIFLILMAMIYFLWVINNINLKDYKENFSDRIHNLGLLRIIFCISVVCTHFFGVLGINKDGVSVEFFFLLSGLFLALTFKPNITFNKFYVKKFIQLVPLTVFGCLICYGGWETLGTLLFLQNTGILMDVANGPAWYVGVLFWISLLYIYILKNNNAKNYQIIGIITFLSCIVCSQIPGDRLDLVFGLFPKGLFRGLACMGSGILLANICNKYQNYIDNKKLKMFYTFIEMLILLIIVGVSISFIRLDYYVYKIILYSLIIYLFVVRKGYLSQILDKPFWSRVSKYCLAIYLTHWFVCADEFGTISLIQHYKPFWFTDYKIRVIVLTIASAIALGVFSYYLVEKPCAKLLKQLLKPSVKN